MEYLTQVDWSKLFLPKFSVLEILLRGMLTYVLLILLLRVVLKRQAGRMALADLLVVTLVAGVCRNPLVADAYSLPDGLGVVAVVLLTGYALDWLSYRSAFIHKALHPAPVPLIRDGRVLRDHLREELLTEDRLRSKLRGEGVKEPAEVAEAWLEGEGQVTVIKRQTPPGPAVPQTRSAAAPDPQELAALARQVQEWIRWHQEAMAGHVARMVEMQAALARWEGWARAAGSGPGR